jgi:cytochrome c-type biogenesis protein CcmH/NrfG
MEAMTRLGVVPARAEILETLALIAAQAGDVSSARSRYQEALALLPPGHRRVRAIQRALDALSAPGNGR